MLLTGFDEEAFVKIMKAEGREEGWTAGLEAGQAKEARRMNQLDQRLLAEKRFGDLERSTEDRAFQEALYAEYGL